MNNVFRLVLLTFLTAAAASRAWPQSAQKRDGKTTARPEWTKGMPPESSVDYFLELRRRMAKGPTARVRAIVQVFLPVALEGLKASGAPVVRVAGTRIGVRSPARYDGLSLLIHHSQLPAVNSCWRAPGCAVEFDLYERRLEAEQARLGHTGYLYEGELKSVSLGSPNAPTGAASPQGKEAGR